jgi:hypothetical protein
MCINYVSICLCGEAVLSTENPPQVVLDLRIFNFTSHYQQGRLERKVEPGLKK